MGWTGKPPFKLLDIGCGKGLRLLSFQERGVEVFGMDFQREAVDHVVEHLGIPAVFTDMEGVRHAFPPCSFDAITAISVMEHVCDIKNTIKVCFSLLKPAGWLAMHLPIVESFQCRVFRSRHVVVTEAPRHVTLPSLKGIERLFSEFGCDPVAFCPDRVLGCAGTFALSVFPLARTPRVYGTGGWLNWSIRAFAGMVTLLAIPWALVENYVIKQPAMIFVFVKKPNNWS
jgi:SAM-dependent methyltransferase